MNLLGPVESVILLLGLASASTCWQIGQQVQTTSGTIVGHASDWKPDVSEYLGIPYGQRPVRFAAPQRFEGSGTINAGNFSPSCPGTAEPLTGPALANLPPYATTFFGELMGQVGDTYDENCLSLNIWTKPQTGEAKKAVMVWIYGGGFTKGGSRIPLYNGARLADENDVIIVSINYRLSIFGFPGVSITPERNPGVLDQRLALEWIRDNIEAFHGDPTKITLWGENAGASFTDYHSFAWPEDSIARAFIVQSGLASNKFAVVPNNTAAWNDATVKLNCPGEDAGRASLECMRSKSVEEIIPVVRPPLPSNGSYFGSFPPSVDNKIIFGDYDARRKNGQFAKAPVLIGDTNNLMGMFELQDCIASNITDCKSDEPPKETELQCLAGDEAAARMAQGVNSWRYLYSATWENLEIGVQGAWHGADLSIIFGTSELVTKPDTPEGNVFGEYVREALTRFAKDPENGLLSLGWPVYDVNKPTIIVLGDTRSSRISFDDPANDVCNPI